MSVDFISNLHRLTQKVFLLCFTVVFCSIFPLYSNSVPFTNQIIVTVIDGENQEKLYGVNVFTDDLVSVATSTDLEGMVTIDDSKLGHLDKINFTYIGYASLKLSLFEIRQRKGLIEMLPAIDLLPDTLVVIGRRDERKEEMPFEIDRIDAKAIAFTNSQTAADLLENEGGVFVQKSQMGGGSPIIRGFEANRVLLVLDGVRMNNAIYRNGHLQNAVTVDNSILEQAEVIYGPGSLIYGSDALGGVVHYRTRDPKLVFGDGPDYHLETNYQTRFSSANLEKNAHLDIDYGGRRWASLTSFTIVDYDDLRAGNNRPEGYPDLGKRFAYVSIVENIEQVIPGNVNIQRPTGYTQIDFLQKIRIQPSDNFYLIGNFQYSTSTNVPRYDVLTDTLADAQKLKYGEWNYGPQKRLLASLKARMLKKNALFNKGTLIGAFQKIDEDRLSREFGDSHRDWNSEDVYVYSFTADFDKNLDSEGRNVLSYGGEFSYNYVNSSAVQQSRRTGKISKGPLSRYASAGNEMMTKAGYLSFQKSNKARTLFFNAGARFTDVSVSARYDSSDLNQINWPEEYINPGIINKNTDLSYSAGFTWNSKGGWQARLLGSRAFRAPNVDDIFKIRVKRNNVLLPNTNLLPEIAHTGELTLGKTFKNKSSNKGSLFKISATGFYTQLQNVIVRRDGFAPNGSRKIPGNNGLDSFNVQQNFNANDGFIFGGSGNLKINLRSKWELNSSISYVKGRSIFEDKDVEGNILFDTLAPMDHIPPLYGRVGLAHIREKIKLEAVVRFNGAKPVTEYAITGVQLDGRTGEVEEIIREGSDNLEFSGTCREITNSEGQTEVVCDGNLAWTTFNFYSSFQLHPKFAINFAVENIFDLHYRKASSGLSAPGRNFIISLRGRF